MMVETERRDPAEWDAEIEAEFQRVKAATAKAGKRKRGRRLIGCPWAFMVDVCQRTEGRAALVVALCIYRRTHVCGSQTVTLPAEELAELGVTRRTKNRALDELQQVGLIKTEKVAAGQSTKVTLTWPRD
jgi:hypothetical protein